MNQTEHTTDIFVKNVYLYVKASQLKIVEGVNDLDSFLTDSLHLELDPEESQKLTEYIYQLVNENNSPYEDMYGTKRFRSGFYNSEYQSNRVDLTMTDFFLLDGKLIVEISNTYFVTENRARFREIINR